VFCTSASLVSFFSLLGCSETVHSVLGPLFALLYQPRMMYDDECGTVGRMIGTGNRSTQRKPVPMPLCPPQIPHDLTWARTWPPATNRLRYGPAANCIIKNRAVSKAYNNVSKTIMFLRHFIFDDEKMSPRNVGVRLQDDTVSQPTRS
jgi:hypothetical protein